MTTPRRMGQWLAAVTLVALLGTPLLFAIAGCSGASRPVAPTPAPPAADSPIGAVQNLRWCWEHLDEANYRRLLTADFQFEFATGDSSGIPYQVNPWAFEDERIFAHNLFVAGSASEAPAARITVTMVGLTLLPDLRPGKAGDAHKSVQVHQALTVERTDGSGLQLSNSVLFDVVRGDSARIPADLRAGPDAARWYVERCVDLDAVSGSARIGASVTQVLPVRKSSLGMLRAQYR